MRSQHKLHDLFLHVQQIEKTITNYHWKNGTNRYSLLDQKIFFEHVALQSVSLKQQKMTLKLHAGAELDFNHFLNCIIHTPCRFSNDNI
jgi:hypothetical protein